MDRKFIGLGIALGVALGAAIGAVFNLQRRFPPHE